MLIGIDLDDMLLDFMTAFISYHNDSYDTCLKKKDFHSYHFWEVLGGTREEAIQKVYDFHSTAYSDNILPLDGAVMVVTTLKEQGHELVILTSRQDDFTKKTKKLVDRYFRNKFSEIYFTNDYSKDGQNRRKSSVCVKAGIDLVIEDQLDYALECVSEKTKVILLDCPWNKADSLPEGITRVKSWKGIVREILYPPKNNKIYK